MSDATFPDTIIAAKPDPRVLDRNYLEHVWKQPAIRQQIESMARTTNGTYKINQTALESIRIPVPSPKKQAMFGSTVGNLKTAATSCSYHLAKLDELFASIQSRAFRGELWQDDVESLEPCL
ncbi:hypothetical protein [Nocardia sp. NPDC058480]|uniref:hypothetical protein n=1 Tax=Nocardia sp. NPDC058480 TaxID=3346522 RepID=UPI003665E2DC